MNEKDQTKQPIILNLDYHELAANFSETYVWDSALYYYSLHLETLDCMDLEARRFAHQQIANLHFQMDLSEKMKPHLDSLYILFQKLTDTVSLDYISYLNTLGNYHLSKLEQDKAWAVTRKALSILSNVKNNNKSEEGASYRIKGKAFNQQFYNQALFAYKHADSLLSISAKKNSFLLMKLYDDRGELYYRLRSYFEAIKSFEQALDIAEQARLPQNTHIAKIYLNLGLANYYLGKLELSLAYYGQALAIFERFPFNNSNMADLYYRKAMAMMGRRNPQMALTYYQKSIKLFSESGEQPQIIAAAYHNIALIHDYYGNRIEALHNIRYALSMYKKVYRSENVTIAKGYMNWGRIFLSLNQLDSASYYLTQSKDIYLEIYPEDHSQLISCDYYLGELYEQRQQFRLANSNYDKALKNAINSYPQKHFRTALAYMKLANLANIERSYEKAIQLSQNSLIQMNKDFDDENYRQNPPLGKNMSDAAYFMDMLILKADILKEKGHAQAQQNDLKLSLDTYLLAQHLLDSVLVNIGSEQDKLNFLTKTYPIYESGLELAWHLYQQTQDPDFLEKAFYLSEKSKTNVLLQGIQEHEALSFENLPEDIVDKEKRLTLEITDLEKRIHLRPEADSLALSSWQDDLFAAKQSYDSLLKVLKEDYPTYYTLKYELEVASIVQVQATLLDDKQVLLEYFLGEKNIYAFHISKELADCKQLPIDFSLDSCIRKLRKGFYGYHIADNQTPELLKQTNDLYAKEAHRLYQKLLAPLEEYLTERLIIIPDGILSYVPFDALLYKPVKEGQAYGSYPYLLNKYAISYSYSATMLAEMKQQQNTPKYNKLLALALSFPEGPTTSQRNLRNGQLAHIPNTQEEVNQIRQLVANKVLREEKASKQNFMRQAPDYRVLHLATHGILDENDSEYSYLALSKAEKEVETGRLYTKDLYLLALNADMVVLSACETGIGELYKGEGFISLARGFSYAGAKSIITTLWSVNDISTSQIMTSFYGFLQEGLSKDMALKEARLKYLGETFEQKNLHPFYWAAAIPIGDTTPLVLAENRSYLWWVALLVLACCAGLVARRFFFVRG